MLENSLPTCLPTFADRIGVGFRPSLEAEREARIDGRLHTGTGGMYGATLEGALWLSPRAISA